MATCRYSAWRLYLFLIVQNRQVTSVVLTNGTTYDVDPGSYYVGEITHVTDDDVANDPELGDEEPQWERGGEPRGLHGVRWRTTDTTTGEVRMFTCPRKAVLAVVTARPARRAKVTTAA